MGEAIGQVLPSAIGVALSPVPIIAVVLILATPQARANGLTFSIGWVLGLSSVSAIVLIALGDSSDPDSGVSDATFVLKLLLGLLFLVMAAKQWRGRPKPGETAELPKWMAAIDDLSPPKSGGLGFLLSGLNPKNLALTLAAAASIAQADLDTVQDVEVLAVFVLLGSVTVVGPAVFYFFAGERAAGPLAELKEFMSANNAVIMMVVLLVLGAKLVGDGLTGLTA